MTVRDKMTPMPNEEVIMKLRELGINDDFLDFILVEDRAYQKLMEIYDEMNGDIPKFVARTNQVWDEIVKETGYKP
jgi:hypothetical protein